MIDVEIKDNRIKILIDGLPHVCLRADEWIGFQSWIGDNNRFYIEFYTKTQDFFTEYNDIKKWKSILKLLNEKL